MFGPSDKHDFKGTQIYYRFANCEHFPLLNFPISPNSTLTAQNIPPDYGFLVKNESSGKISGPQMTQVSMCNLYCFFDGFIDKIIMTIK